MEVVSDVAPLKVTGKSILRNAIQENTKLSNKKGVYFYLFI